MHKRLSLLILLVGVIFAHQAFGAESSFSSGITAVTNQIFSNETAVFQLSVYSVSERLETFSIYTDVEWSLSTLPAEDKNLRVFPGSNKETTLLIKPKSEARMLPGAYQARIYLKNTRTGEVLTNNVLLHIKGSGGTDHYLPSIRAETVINERIDPREPIQIKLILENQNPATIEALNIIIQSELFSIQDIVPMEPLEKKELTYTTYIKDTQGPMIDSVKANLIATIGEREFEFNSLPAEYEVIEYGGIEEIKETEKAFLKWIISHHLKNTGNIDRQHSFTIKRNIFIMAVQGFSEDPVRVKLEGKRYYSWDIYLPVKGERIIVETINLRPMVLAILIISALLAVFFRFRSPVLISKSMSITSQKHGGIAEINIQMDIRNRSPHPLSDIIIKDKVPNMFEIVKEFDMGTLHPEQILKNDKKGTILKWGIKEIDPFEERIITYRLASKLNIIGKFALPVASITFVHRKKTKVTYSNRVILANNSRDN